MKNLKFVIAIISCSFFFNIFANATTAKINTQKWYNIVSKVNRLNLDVNGASKQAKAKVWMYKPNNSSAQKWKFEHAGGGYYYIKVACSGMYLDVPGSSKKSGTFVWQYPKNRTNAQKWKLINAGGGYYYIQSKVSGLFLDVQGGRKASKTPVWQYKLNRTDAQKWYLKPLKRKTKKLSTINKAVKAAIFGPSTKGKKIFGHKFNFGQNTSVKINKKTGAKTVYVRFDHVRSYQFDDKYYFKAIFDKKNKLLRWEYKINRGGFLPKTTSSVSATRFKKTARGLSPVAIDKLASKARRKLSRKNSWERAAKEIAMIIAKAAVSYKK